VLAEIRKGKDGINGGKRQLVEYGLIGKYSF